MNEEYCDQCENRCPKDSLRCNRGRRRFGLEPAPHGPMKGLENLPGPLKALLECGHLLHHGELNGGELLSALSGEEQAELERLLGVLLADWRTRLPEREHGRDHHRERGHR